MSVENITTNLSLNVSFHQLSLGGSTYLMVFRAHNLLCSGDLCDSPGLSEFGLTTWTQMPCSLYYLSDLHKHFVFIELYHSSKVLHAYPQSTSELPMEKKAKFFSPKILLWFPPSCACVSRGGSEEEEKHAFICLQKEMWSFLLSVRGYHVKPTETLSNQCFPSALGHAEHAH